ncbi:hypothetical protein K490DRAFT_65555 [Saccharata proteae CBS 121410]|uniref:Uncharacterized protein n=1 Tax=Saccharata proteae CBS 121410 TaxID=1314787 RepID=A0A9P4HXJ7_9PEZI|nr:hypothetical protein K490DRAFT_65555 [Saccharata proteae CBS 121410]
MAQVMLQTAPTSRQDIVSAILSDYADGDADFYSPVEPEMRIPSPKTKESVVGFQVRVRDAAPRRETVAQPDPKQKERDASTASTASTVVASRSLSRSRKPSRLNLKKSNGSTALPNADQVSVHSSPSTSHQLPLPPLPPHPPQKHDQPAQGDALMGNRASKPARDSESQSCSPTAAARHHLPFRRKPVKSNTSSAIIDHPPVVDGTAEKPLPPHPKKTKSDISLAHASHTADSHHSHTQSDPTTLTDVQSSQSNEQTSRERSDTPPSEVEEDEPLTPVLKPAVALLPSPSPVPEESPSKYGLAKKPSMTSVSDSKTSMHFRGKSSTGFDIFKNTSKAQKSETRTFQNTLSPPASPPANDTSNHKYTEQRPATTSTLERFRAARPRKTNAAALSIVQTDCFHSHRRFHRSHNGFAPVACMVCYATDKEDRWTCSWCALRICQNCRGKLESVPKKNLDVLLRARLEGVDVGSVKIKGAAPGPGPDVVVWEA